MSMSEPGSKQSSAPSSPRGLSLAIFLGLLVLLITLLSLLSGPSQVDASGAGLRQATIDQKGRMLVMKVRSGRNFALRRLARQPDFSQPAARYLCFELRRSGEERSSRVCLGGRGGARRQAGIARLTSKGKVLKPATIPVKVKGSSTRGLKLSFPPGRAGLVPGKYSWRVRYSDGGCLDNPRSCRSSFPRSGNLRYRLRPVAVVGCTGGNGAVVNRGPRGKRRVALTFDDGPSSYTPRILRILRRKKVAATFFMLGDQVAADPAGARRVLAAGHEIGNHSSDHALLPGYSNLKRANRQIRRATGFKPCLFRPPYGALSSSVKQSARELGMKSIIWDIDTSDWSTPGSGAIRSRISNAGPGSIVLMHDGGGPRSQTVDALPGAIHDLRSRGFSFVTVSRLLGSRLIFRPR
jgi:peptidoglycan/xylan/chitin deacetylase (PgdA/CDA1 family)